MNDVLSKIMNKEMYISLAIIIIGVITYGISKKIIKISLKYNINPKIVADKKIIINSINTLKIL